MKAIYFTLIFIIYSFVGSAQTLEWVKSIPVSALSLFGSPRTTMMQDSEGNVFVFGDFSFTVDFDPGPNEQIYTATGLATGFVLKLDSDGNFVWVKIFEGEMSSEPLSASVNIAGDIILTGTFNGSIDFDPGPDEEILIGLEDFGLFAVSLDSSGNLNWARGITGIESISSCLMDIDDDDNIYMTGTVTSILDVDPGTNEHIIESDGSPNPFIVKLDSEGLFVWAKTYGGDGIDKINDIEVVDNQLFVAGTFQNDADLNPEEESFAVTAIGVADAYFSKFDLDGNFLWASTITGSSSENIIDLCLDVDGNILLTGSITEEGVFGSSPNEVQLNVLGEDGDAFVAKFNNDGSFLWAKSFGGVSRAYGSNIKSDSFGNIYVCGGYDGAMNINLGNSELNFSTASLYYGSYVLKTNINGDLIWAHNFNDNESDVFNFTMDLNDSESLIISGMPGMNTDFDPDPSTEINIELPTPFFVAKYSQGPCDNFSLSFDSLANFSCVGLAYLSAIGLNGTEPIDFQWNTNPVNNGSILEPESGGLYELTATDAAGCVKTSIANIEEPSSLTQQDLLINMLSTEFRTGFPATAWVDALNDGCEAVSGTISIVKDPLIDFESETIPPDEIIGDSLVWNFENYVYESGHFQSALNFTTSLEAQIGDTICFDIYINPEEGDVNPENNHRHYCYPVVNGYDPNDKQVYPQGECEEHYTLNDEVLTYTVRFQNTGNSEAINIHVIDSLSPFLDINTLSVVAKSHEMFTEFLPVNVLNFKFDNILLPDSASNEEGSQGYVIFEISPLGDLPNGTIIENTSEIYFDFNPAVVTNTTFNTLVDEIPNCSIVDGLEEGKSRIILSVYPNPTEENIELRCEYEMEQISGFDFAGRLVLESKVQGTYIQMELSSLNAGIYFVHVQTSEGMVVKKVVVN